jgi:hypothetical protein
MTWIENAFLFDDYPSLHESVNALRHLVVRHLLKECGDAEGAALILEALHAGLAMPESPDQNFFRLLCRYAAQELDATTPRLPAIWPRSEHNALSLALWGDDYIDRFNRYCATSLAADGNIPALKARGKVTLLVHTAARDVPKIRRLNLLRSLGINVRIWAIPDELLQLAAGDMKYWMLGAIQSIHLFYAAQRRANFLPIFPDGFYSERYFENLLEIGRNGEDAVFLSAFRASRAGMAPHLDRFSKGGAYAVPAANLVELSLRHLHPYILHAFIDPYSGTLPQRRMLFASCGDYVEIRSPHYNPALIRNSVIAGTRPRYLMTLDSEIDKVLPATSKIHFRSIADDYFATELMDERTDPPSRVGFEEYAKFFVEYANSAHLRFEQSPYRIAIRPEWLGSLKALSPRDATLCFDRICKLVEERIGMAHNFERVDLVLNLLQQLGQTDLSQFDRELLAFANESVRQRAGQKEILQVPT